MNSTQPANFLPFVISNDNTQANNTVVNNTNSNTNSNVNTISNTCPTCAASTIIAPDNSTIIALGTVVGILAFIIFILSILFYHSSKN